MDSEKRKDSDDSVEIQSTNMFKWSWTYSR